MENKELNKAAMLENRVSLIGGEGKLEDTNFWDIFSKLEGKELTVKGDEVQWINPYLKEYSFIRFLYPEGTAHPKEHIKIGEKLAGLVRDNPELRIFVISHSEMVFSSLNKYNLANGADRDSLRIYIMRKGKIVTYEYVFLDILEGFKNNEAKHKLHLLESKRLEVLMKIIKEK